jgi:hypothetical protein
MHAREFDAGRVAADIATMTTTRTDLMPRRTNRSRRGIAMLLVLLSLAMATIITTAYLSSRDNSAAIGENVIASAEARYASQSGVDLAIAILQTPTGWRIAHTDGVLLSAEPLGAALVDVEVMDLETQDPPTAETTDVLVTAIAVVDGIEQVSTAEVHVNPAALGAPTVDLDLSEFAAIGGRLVLNGNATLMRWPTAPASAAGKRIALGTTSTTAGSVVIDGNAAALDATVFHVPGASSALVDNGSGPLLQLVELAGVIPMPDAPTAPGDPPLGGQLAYHETGAVAIVNDLRVGEFLLDNTGTIGTVTGDTTIVVEADMDLSPHTGLLVDGDVTVVVHGGLTLATGSFIELAPGATLEMYVEGPVTIRDSYIGDERADRDVRDNTGAATWMDVERLRLYGTGAATSPWVLDRNSVVKGSLYLPRSPAKIAETSALYGRVGSEELVVSDGAALFYDHALDSGLGFTNLDSLVYRDNGDLIDAISSLGSFDDADLIALSKTIGLNVEVDGKYVGDAVDAGSVATEDGKVTPRTVEVRVEYTALGNDMSDWEAAAVAKARDDGSVGFGGVDPPISK